MSPKLATKRYLITIMGSGLAYIGAVLGVSFVHDKFTDGSITAILISAIPGIFIALMALSLWRFLNETDEVARHELTQAMMSTLFIILALCGGWGLIELFNDDAPRLPVFFIFPAFFLAFGLVSGIRYRRCA